jgi:hypothetical protein
MGVRAVEVVVGPDGGLTLTQEHLDEIRHEMADGLGDDLTV